MTEEERRTIAYVKIYDCFEQAALRSLGVCQGIYSTGSVDLDTLVVCVLGKEEVELLRDALAFVQEKTSKTHSFHEVVRDVPAKEDEDA